MAMAAQTGWRSGTSPRESGTDWDTVHLTLQSMQDEGAIRIEGHRLIINKGLLQKVVGLT